MTTRVEDVVTYLADHPWSTAYDVGFALGICRSTAYRCLYNMYKAGKVMRRDDIIHTIRKCQDAVTMTYALAETNL